MKILVTGGRWYDNAARVKEALDLYLGAPNLMIIQGGASGADYLAKRWAEANSVHCAEVKALWASRGKAAGHLRNEAMIFNLCPDIIVAFSGGAGTRNCIETAKRYGKTVVEISD